VRADRVVVFALLLDQHLRVLLCVEDLAVEQFVTQFAVESLRVAILPWAARLDEWRLRAYGFHAR